MIFQCNDRTKTHFTFDNCIRVELIRNQMETGFLLFFRAHLKRWYELFHFTINKKKKVKGSSRNLKKSNLPLFLPQTIHRRYISWIRNTWSTELNQKCIFFYICCPFVSIQLLLVHSFFFPNKQTKGLKVLKRFLFLLIKKIKKKKLQLRYGFCYFL